jgi:ubiquinone/menaquinone biosynthesis C-methylase UbiE
MSSIQLPYFDLILNELKNENPDMKQVFGRHVHWGYWPEPKNASGTVEDFAEAAEKLSQIICDAAGIKDGMRVLDVGCGFGGTIASLNERFSGLDLVGLNIDERQLERARKEVTPINNNKIEFIQGNACELPFTDQSFDAVIAVECIFHFPDREAFFQEAKRVLRTSKSLALSDFILANAETSFLFAFSALIEQFIALFYGKFNNCTLEDYAKIAEKTGLITTLQQDITAEILPTYDFLLSLLGKAFIPYWTTKLIQLGQKYRRIIYQVLAYRRP